MSFPFYFKQFSLAQVQFLPLNGLVGGVFANGPGDLGSIPGHIIHKTLEMVLDTTLLNTPHYKERIKGKVDQSRESSSDLPYTLVEYLLKSELSGHPRLRSPTLLFFTTVLMSKTVLYQTIHWSNSV